VSLLEQAFFCLEKKMRTVKLEDIRIDGGTQFRDQINQDVVKEYGHRMEEGEIFPPLKATFDGVTYWLYDGFHRYFAAHDRGFKTIEVDYKPGSQEDAQDLALSANAHHGLQRNNATKRKTVEAALAMPRHAGKSNVQIAKLCDVSDTFVAAVRNPEVKKKQAEKVAKHYQDKLGSTEVQVGDVVANTPQVGSTEAPPVDGSAPDAAELLANEMAAEADRELMNKLLDSDDALATAHEELTRLNFLNGQLQVRIASLMNEKNEAIAQCKKLQKQLDKVSKK
jgi:hypothetical protein